MFHFQPKPGLNHIVTYKPHTCDSSAPSLCVINLWDYPFVVLEKIFHVVFCFHVGSVAGAH